MFPEAKAWPLAHQETEIVQVIPGKYSLDVVPGHIAGIRLFRLFELLVCLVVGVAVEHNVAAPTFNRFDLDRRGRFRHHDQRIRP